MAPYNTNTSSQQHSSSHHQQPHHSQQHTHHHHHPNHLPPPGALVGNHTANTNDVLSSSSGLNPVVGGGGGGSSIQQQHHHSAATHQHHQHQHHNPHHQLHHQPPPLNLHHNQHFERSSSTTTSATTTTFLVPVTSSGLNPLDTSSFLSAAAVAAAGSPHFVTSSPVAFSSPHPQVGAGASAASSSSTSSSYTFVQIKREPCQVSEVTTSNTNHHHHQQQQQHHHHQQQQQHHHHHSAAIGSLTSAGSLTAAAAAAKTMSSSTLTTLVKIEASSPKVHDMDKGHMTSSGSANMVNSSNNTVPIGIAVARKRPQETTAPPPPGPPPSLTSSSTLPLSQQLNKDMNCFGIRVADLGGVGTGCGNFYFTGNGDLMTSSATADELALNAASLQQSVNRASSTFWQYPNALPIESVISMSPATVGLQYSREASRGQVVLLPATATSLGLSNCPILCTPTDPFQQAAAAAFVWPSYIPQGTAPATLQPPPNFIFPSMSPHSTLQAAAAAQPYATSLQFLGSNYLTAAAAAAATLCQHNQQTNSTSSSINLSLGGSVVSGAASGTTMSSSSSSTTTRFMSLATAAGPPPPAINDTGQAKGGGGVSQTKTLASASGTHTLALAPGPASLLSASTSTGHPLPPPPHPLLIPPSALKLEDWSGADFMAAAAHFVARDKHATTNATTTTTHPNATNLLELPASATQALNLMRLPTPPTSATIDTATGATSNSTNLSSGTTAINLATHTNFLNAPAPAHAAQSALTETTTTIGPPTPLSDDMALNFKSNLDGTPPQLVVGVPRVVNPALPTIPAAAIATASTATSVGPASQAATSAPGPPQMQDVNIQTDTPVCSEDENSSCPLNQNNQCSAAVMGAVASSNPMEPCTMAQCTPPLTQNDELYHDSETQEPLELTKTNTRPPSTPHVESSSLREDDVADPEEEYQMKSPLKQTGISNFGVVENALNDKPEESHPQSVTPAIISSSTTPILAEAATVGGGGGVPDATTTNATTSITTSSNQEDLTGLELLSNISTSNLVKCGAIRVKQEPLDPVNDQNMCHAPPAETYPALESNSYGPVDLPQTSCDHQINSVAHNSVDYPNPPSPLQQTIHAHEQPRPPSTSHQTLSNLSRDEVEPLGGLKLLCALAEQRIQEEEEVQSTTLNNSNGFFRPPSSESPHSFATTSFPQSTFVKPASSSASFQVEAQNSSFPSLETLELPSTSSTNCFSTPLNGTAEEAAIPVKRKKHKHSKSSKSSSSNSNGSSSKKSQKCGKKNKKKYSKEKKRHRQAMAEVQQTDLDFDDPQLQQELQNAFQNCVDPNYQRMGGKWPTPQEIFSIMESSMRMRLAEITRQYRKKKRKLDEISKNKKKKKCSKLQAAAQQLSLVGNSTSLSTLVGGNERCATTTTTSSLTSSPLCDYKFGNFSSKSNTTNSSNYLAPSSFIRFATDSGKSQSHHHLHHHHQQTHPQFPPPPEVELENDNVASVGGSNSTTITPIYKPLRLEPSSLAAASNEQRSNGSGSGGTSSVLRLAQKHASSEKLCHVIVCKERKLASGSRRSSVEDEDNEYETPNHDNQQQNGRRSLSTDNEAAPQQQQQQSAKSTTSSSSSTSTSSSSSRKINPIDRSLMLTQDHLFRKETRVLTDMGGLFYAGIMKPLQPPDVYAITLDGERGNKSHIMSREEIFNDTILEVAPKTVEDVPVGTRLCAYWSQQYRCLYPGRAIESESSDDGVTSQEFVSVEFDDGDSGRIRLQNIRYLLSDYPIVEYNDNPLYSLGKQKKANANKNLNNNDTDHHQHQRQHQQPEINGEGGGGLEHGQDEQHKVTSNGSTSHRDYHQATAMEIFAAKRSEKKRNKSLKKKSQNANANTEGTNSAVTTNGTSNVSSSSSSAANGNNNNNINGSLETSECLRKHHKHKKRKKHKKHRKNLMEIGIVSEMDKKQASTASSYSPTSSSFNHKTERTKKEATTNSVSNAVGVALTQHPKTEVMQEGYDEEPEEEEEDDIDDQPNNTQTEDSQMAADEPEEEEAEEDDEYEDNDEDNIKHNINQTAHQQQQQHVKVKTEHLEMEEESTSNLMSEISDEAKADDLVEHNSSKGSKIAAFLPDRQLWGWLGTAYCKFGTKGTKGRIRKQFYKTIKRGKEKITVGDCAVFLSTGRPDRPYIGRIESMWENSCNNKIVRVRWFYHPEETTGCPKLKFPGALFESPHEDENDVQTISHRCEVLQFARYFNKFGADSKQYQSIYDNNDTYYLAGYYNPRLQVLKLQDNIPTLEEQQQPQQQQQQQLQKHQSPIQQQNTTTTATVINSNNISTNHTNINND